MTLTRLQTPLTDTVEVTPIPPPELIDPDEPPENPTPAERMQSRGTLQWLMWLGSMAVLGALLGDELAMLFKRSCL